MPNPHAKLMQDLGVMAQLACVWEATARKPGNAHRYADFDDLSYVDFLASAAAIAPVLDKAWFRPVGEVVLEAIQATRRVVQTNTNLGIVLLLAPLAAVVPGRELRDEVPRILRELTITDATLVYEAIRLAEPGGLGEVAEQDIRTTPTITLLEAMRLAESRDRIAWQYTHDFVDVFGLGVSTIAEELAKGRPLEKAITRLHLRFLAEFPDSLIARKHGDEAAEEVRRNAEHALSATPEFTAYFDSLLRSHGWNPGTSADLVAASLFAALRAGIIPLPHRWR